MSRLDTILQMSGLSYISILILTQNAFSIAGMSLQTGGILKDKAYEKIKGKIFWKLYFVFL